MLLDRSIIFLEQILQRRLKKAEYDALVSLYRQPRPGGLSDEEYVMQQAMQVYMQVYMQQSRQPVNLDTQADINTGIDTGIDLDKILKETNVSDIQDIMGIKSLKKLAAIFNPAAVQKKAYITLDSKYARFLDNNTRLQWDYSETLVDTGNSVNSTNSIGNITEMKIYSVVVPKFTSTLSRGTILVEEFQSQSFICPNGRRFHFMGLLNDLLTPITSFNYIPLDLRAASVAAEGFVPDFPCDKYELLSGYRFNEGAYRFTHPINRIDTLTISIGDPLTPISIPRYRYTNVTVVSLDIIGTGAYPSFPYFGEIVLQTFEPHYLPTNAPANTYSPDWIFSLKFTEFNTDDPVADATLITYMKTMEFTSVVASGTNTITNCPKNLNTFNPENLNTYAKFSKNLNTRAKFSEN